MTTGRLHFIERPAATQATGLLVLLHGVGGNEHNLAALAAAQDPSLHVILPRAPLAFGVQQFGWFPVQFGAQGPVIDAALAESSRRCLLDFLAGQQGRLGIAPERTVIAGFSQGGIMSASVALTSPAAVAGFAVLSGRILPEIEPLIAADVGNAGLQALLLHGRADTKLPFALAEAASARLRRHGVDHELRGYDAGHELTADMAADFSRWLQGVLPER